MVGSGPEQEMRDYPQQIRIPKIHSGVNQDRKFTFQPVEIILDLLCKIVHLLAATKRICF